MAINKSMRRVLKALSFDEVDVDVFRHVANIKAIDPMKVFYKTVDDKVYNGDYEVPVRIYLPSEEVTEECPVLLFFHGGGWVTESIDNYRRVCSRMAVSTNHMVVAVEYRLAPEYPFPTGFDDCYAVAKAIYSGEYMAGIDTDKITLMGDSAGGNLAAAVSLKARDTGDFLPKRQILIYPALSGKYGEDSPYASVTECGRDYLLTMGKMQDYIDLYASCEEDRENKYFAPLEESDYSNQPRTLVLTAEYDPLRDEGEEYGKRLKKAGNRVDIYRVKDALHGYFALGIKYLHVRESFEIINRFLGEE